MKAADPPSPGPTPTPPSSHPHTYGPGHGQGGGQGQPLSLIQSHLSVEAAPYVRNPSPAEAAAEEAIEGGGDRKEEGESEGWRKSETTLEPVEELVRGKEEYVEPGWRGWLNVGGSVAVNMICCEYTWAG